MRQPTLAAALVGIVAWALPAQGTEMTFEMRAGERDCFYEEIERGTKATLEFQVVYGGHLDIDVEINDGHNKIWGMDKAQTGSHSFVAGQAGTFAVCFSNKMSTVAHKMVYFDYIVGLDDPLLEKQQKRHQTFTQLETSMLKSHDSLRRTLDLQTHHRMREATHRHTAEYMNERVQVVSACEAILLIFLSIFQVIYLRSLFTDKPNRW